MAVRRNLGVAVSGSLVRAVSPNSSVSTQQSPAKNTDQESAGERGLALEVTFCHESQGVSQKE